VSYIHTMIAFLFALAILRYGKAKRMLRSQGGCFEGETSPSDHDISTTVSVPAYRFISCQVQNDPKPQAVCRRDTDKHHTRLGDDWSCMPAGLVLSRAKAIGYRIPDDYEV
jgi:hypothetical protein